MIDLRTCEICGKRFVTGYGYSLMLHWLVTGHAHVAAFICHDNPSGQHWGCSPEHAIEAVQRCLNEHMNKENIVSRHNAAHIGDQIAPRFAEEHRKWAEKRGEDFHIVKSKADLHRIIEDMMEE